MFQGQIYQPDEGVTMGSLMSGTIAKIFRCVDDILTIYNSTCTTYEFKLQYTNGIYSNMRLKPTTKTNGRINYLDLLITRNPAKLEISIFRKPTSTDTTINFHSNHPLEHKIAAYRFHIERMFTARSDKNDRRNRNP